MQFADDDDPLYCMYRVQLARMFCHMMFFFFLYCLSFVIVFLPLFMLELLISMEQEPFDTC